MWIYCDKTHSPLPNTGPTNYERHVSEKMRRGNVYAARTLVELGNSIEVQKKKKQSTAPDWIASYSKQGQFLTALHVRAKIAGMFGYCELCVQIANCWLCLKRPVSRGRSGGIHQSPTCDESASLPSFISLWKCEILVDIAHGLTQNSRYEIELNISKRRNSQPKSFEEDCT